MKLSLCENETVEFLRFLLYYSCWIKLVLKSQAFLKRQWRFLGERLGCWGNGDAAPLPVWGCSGRCLFSFLQLAAAKSGCSLIFLQCNTVLSHEHRRSVAFNFIKSIKMKFAFFFSLIFSSWFQQSEWCYWNGSS